MDVDIDDFDNSFDVDDDFLRDLDNAELSLVAASQVPDQARLAPHAEHNRAVKEPVRSSDPQRTSPPSTRYSGPAFTFGAAARPPARLPPGHALRQQQHLARPRDPPVRSSHLLAGPLVAQQLREAVPAVSVDDASCNVTTDEAQRVTLEQQRDAALEDQLVKVSDPVQCGRHKCQPPPQFQAD
jgi:hypothetical protein